MVYCLVDNCECIRDDGLDTVNKVRHEYIKHGDGHKTARLHEHDREAKHKHLRRGSKIFTAISPELLKATFQKLGESHKPHRPWKLNRKSLKAIYKAHEELEQSKESTDDTAHHDVSLIKPIYHSPYARPDSAKITRSKSDMYLMRDQSATLHNKLKRSLREGNAVIVENGDRLNVSAGIGERQLELWKSNIPPSGTSGFVRTGEPIADNWRRSEGSANRDLNGSLVPSDPEHGNNLDGSAFDVSFSSKKNVAAYDQFSEGQQLFISDTLVENRLFDDTDLSNGKAPTSDLLSLPPRTSQQLADEAKNKVRQNSTAGPPRPDQLPDMDSSKPKRRTTKNSKPNIEDQAIAFSRKTTIPTVHLNEPLHEEVSLHTSDPVLVSINAPPPFPAHLIDPSTNYSSNFTPLQHDARLKSIIAESKGAHVHDKRTSVGPSPAVIVPVLPVEQQVEAATPLTAKEMEQSIKKSSLLPSIVIKQVDKHEDRSPKGKIKGGEQKDERSASLEKPVDKVVPERRFKDILEEILAPNGKKWAELCRLEFPDNVMWKTDGNLASLIVAYVECCVTQCKKLSLKAFYLRRLPPLVWLRHYLRSLNISFNRLEEMPSSIFYLRNLSILKARNNPMIVIDDQISRLTNLRYLVLSFCLFKEIPSSLFTLSGLEILDVSYNLLRHIPREIMKMRSLRVVNISGNLIYELPACMVRLPRLSSILAADCYVNLTSGRRAINTVWHLSSLKDLAADIVAKRMMEEGTDPRDVRHTLYVPEPIVPILRSGHHCEWCGNPRYGIGHNLIKAEAVKKLRYSAFMLRFQVCARCCRNPYHVFTAEELEKHIALGQAELEKAEAMERARREKQAQDEAEKLKQEENIRKSKKSR